MIRERQIRGCVLNLNAANPDNTATGAADKSDYRQAESTYQGGMGVVDGEFVFDGVDDFISKEIAQVSSTVFTLSAWFRDAGSSTDDTIISLAGLTSGQYSSIGFQSGRLRLTIRNSATNSLFSFGFPELTVGQLHHIVATSDGTTARLYQDGVEIGSTPVTIQGFSPVNLRVGSRTAQNFLGLTGAVRSAQIFNRVLSPGEIQLLASDVDFIPFGNYGKEILSIQPQRYLGSGDLLDESGNENNGVLQTGSTVVDDKITITSGSGVVVPNTIFAAITKGFSFSAFVKPDSLGTRQSIFAASTGGAATNARVSVTLEASGVIQIGGRLDDSTHRTFTSAATLTADNRSFVACGINPATNEWFITIDGTTIVQTSTAEAISTSAVLNAALGSFASSFWRFEGTLEDVRIHNQFLSPEEIKYLYNNGVPGVEVPNTYGSVGYWSPSYDDAGNGSLKLLDYSGAANVGTLTNMDTDDWVDDTEDGGTRKLTFDGVDDKIATPSVGTEIGLGEITLVVRFTASSDFHGQILAGADWHIRLTSGRPVVTIGSESVVINASVTNTVGWHLLIAWRDSAGAIHYMLDGLQSFSNRTASDIGVVGGVSIGGGSDFVEIDIDDVVIYDRVLTAEETAELTASRNPFAESLTILPPIFPSRLRRLLLQG